jgi:hypothetical protein
MTKGRVHADWSVTYVAELVRLYGMPADDGDDGDDYHSGDHADLSTHNI